MDYTEIIPGGGGMENWMPGSMDQAIWATEEDYSVWNGDSSVDNYGQLRPENEPPNKRVRSIQGGDSQLSGFNKDLAGNKSRLIGKMFFKTKLCCKFRNGTCPYITNCNFAHGIEELRKPPPNWQDIVASQDEDGGVLSQPREEHQIPSLSSVGLGGENQRSRRHCKKFYTEEGCPYGDNCTYIHDEQSKARESVAISLGPSMSNPYGNNVNGITLKPSNWKTRICNKWETTGYCPFGSKCHFAHGYGELHRYGGGLVEMDGRDPSLTFQDSKQVGVASKAPNDTGLASSVSASHSDMFHMGVPSQRSAGVNQRPGERPLQKWKGPNKISRIYGDWIDDDERD
ncbi:hypothetical protein GIB67_030153 [Kingdonia uniflora]|uniref:C3H1-type domain-containing protein n=1 Tax=Kingdonia uniflora TaxID=39325 RepID=A0A7J7LEG2_9MAGN|nr:hypothetical protein GIB67_030153 [Kingdonia uniflora]